MKKFTLMVLSILMATTALAQYEEPKTITLTDAERQLVENNNKFALRLFQKARTDESLLLSPLSITVDLGMLNNGADGITREEIDAVLGSKDVGGADVINQFCLKMLNESGSLDDKTKVAMANNIYVNSAAGNQLLPAFVETAKNYYDATPESRDFHDGKTREVINKWGSDHTEGMIEEAIKEEEFNPDAVSYLLNALYFKGEWTHKFVASQTHRYMFDQGRKEVQMMHQESDFSYTENKVYQSVILPYGNMAYQMTVFLPQYGKTIDDVVNKLSSDKWSENDYDPCHVDLYMPRFETETDIRLENIMKSLGMPNAFEGGYGFNEFCNDNVFIGMMKQVAKIKLDEEGTEAAAVTVIELDKASTGPRYAEFIADRPFLYVISERSTGSIFFIGQYMGDPLTNVRKDISLTDEEKQLVEGNNDFAFRLFRKARGEESSIMSPLSITYALGMMNNGAAGQTQQEINTVLGSAGVGSPDAINAFCRKMLTESGALDEETRVDIANTIYVNNHWGYELKPPFVQKANDYYDAQPESRDFYDGETCDVINQWASDHTQGMIKKILGEDEFNQDAVSYLMNAIYFKGTWASKFDKTNTRDEAFNGGEKVPMMRQTAEFEYTDNDLYQAVRLPYGNGAYLMTVFLPREGKTIATVLDQMDGKNWEFKGGRSTDVDLKMPRFETETNIKLKPVMTALGMPTAFDPYNADFSAFCNVPTYIGMMKQAAKIKLDEEGTEAAAVTIIGAETTAMPDFATFHATRPFFYIISERSTGAIFFMGQYVGNTATGIGAPALYEATPSHRKTIYSLSGQRLQAPPAKGIYIENGRKHVSVNH